MESDAITYALANMRQRLMCVDNGYGPSITSQRLVILEILRDHAIMEDAVGFTAYCQDSLCGFRGDHIVDILEELWDELGLDGMHTCWDEFAEINLNELTV